VAPGARVLRVLRVLPAGDRGALVEVDDNASALRVAALLRARGGFVDVVPGHRTVLVTWEGERPPLELDEAPAEAVPGKLVEVPVVYDGPDLAEVARLADSEDVVALHTAPEYTVGFVGFAPGFAYLLGGDERLFVPRLDAPRERVPAGSVAVAGPYSAVYPRASPGGWRLIGRTDLTLFDAARDRPALLEPGDRVRFVAC
jgi:KipI family sensor histidine kinase inhibitor